MGSMNEDHTIRIDIPATYKYLNVLGSCIRAILQHEKELVEFDILAYNIELAVHETCANIIAHAYEGQPGRIRIAFTLSAQPPCLMVDLHDTGQSFQLSEVPHPDLEQANENGYGLFLIRQLMDEVTYRPEEGNNHWHLIKKLA